MKKLCLVLGLMLTASMLLAACGGSDSDSSDSSGALSKSEWIAQADDVCQEYQDEAQDLTGEIEDLELSSSSSSDQLAKAAGTLREIGDKTKEEVAELRQLEPPSADKQTIDSLLTKVETDQGIGMKAADAMEDKDEAKLSELIAEGGEIDDEASKIAKDYGLKVCGS